MTREEARRYAFVAELIRRDVENSFRTLGSTSMLTADEVQVLQTTQNVQLFKDYPAAKRRDLAKTGAALPDGSFPIVDCADAADAIRSIGRADPAKRSRAEGHIRKRVRALSCSGSIFERWK